LLEQVKHRETNITLRSVPVLETIKNAIEHRANNKALDITVRFSTNANIGREQSALMKQLPPKMGLLHLWESLRKHNESSISRLEAINLIKSYIADLTKPKKFNSWQTLQEFLRIQTTKSLTN